jgi:hypothetical protein
MLGAMNPYSPPAPPSPYADAPPGYGAPQPQPGAGAVTDLAVDLLRQTRPWVMFLSILAFLGCAGMLIMGLLMIGVGLMASGGAEKGIQAAVGVVYLPMAGLYIYPAIKMWMYGSAIGRLLVSKSTPDLETALLQQKSLWKFSGIAAIVVIGIYILFIIGAVIWGVAMGMGKL